MFTKITLKMRTYYMTLSINELIEKVLDDNILIKTIAKEEFLKRDLSNLDVPEDILNKIITKLSIEEIWELVKSNQDINNRFIGLVIDKLNCILEFYEKNYPNDYLLKVNEKNKILKFTKD